MIANEAFINSIAGADLNTLTYIGERATAAKRNAKTDEEREQFEAAEWAILLEMRSRNAKAKEDHQRRTVQFLAAAR